MATQLAEQALGLYDLPRNSTVQLISLSENETYKVEAPGGRRWALRLQRPGYQSKNSLASEIAWLVALRERWRRRHSGSRSRAQWGMGSGCAVAQPMGNSETWFFLNGKTATSPRLEWICASVSGPWGRSPRRCMRTAEHGSGRTVLNDSPGTLRLRWGRPPDGAVGAMGWA